MKTWDHCPLCGRDIVAPGVHRCAPPVASSSDWRGTSTPAEWAKAIATVAAFVLLMAVVATFGGVR